MSVSAYRIARQKSVPLRLPVNAGKTLDEITRALPQGFYTTFITLGGGKKVLGLRAHLQRLYLPAETFAADEATLRARIASLAERNLPKESRVRVILAKESGAIYVLLEPFTPPPPSIYESGVRVVTAETTRRDPRLKQTVFISESAAQRARIGGEIYEVLLTKGGKIYEGMTSNFYAVAGGKIITARKGILLGVTRRAVLRLARGEGASIEYRPPRLDEPFDEAFLTSSSRGIVPIVSINGKPVGEGKAGAWTKRLMKAYREDMERKAEEICSEKP